MTVPNKLTKKLDDRSLNVVNLGKELGTKAYRLYDPESNRVLVSRDVVFAETEAWPWEGQNEEEKLQREKLIVLGENVYNETTHSENNVLDSSTRVEQRGEQIFEDENVDGSTEPKKYRSVTEIYNSSEPIELQEELLFMGVEEPINFGQDNKEKCWRQAMKNEIDAIERNGTWELTELPKGHKVIGLKWIFKLKRDTSGNVVKHKSRLVEKGYSQEHGVDFDEIYAPVTRLETVRVLLALAAKNSRRVYHMDVKTAFLNGEICQEVYVMQPEGKGKDMNQRYTNFSRRCMAFDKPLVHGTLR